MIRSKFSPDNMENGFVVIKFDDPEDPFYPLTGDQVELYEEESGLSTIGTIKMVNWSTRLIYLSVNQQTQPIDQD